MVTKISSIRFENEHSEDGSAGRYVVELIDENSGKENPKSINSFQHYSWMDYIVPFKVENAKKRLIADAEKYGNINPERKYAPSYTIRGYIETTEIPGGTIITLVDADNPNQDFIYNTSIWKGSSGLNLNVRLGRNDLKEYDNSPPVYTVSLGKIIGEKRRIRKNILPEINVVSDKEELDVDEKVMIMNELEYDISQILSAPAQQIARKPA